MIRFIAHFRKALVRALKHDVVNTAKAAAYSGMLMFFPAVLLFTTLLAQAPEGTSRAGEIRAALEQFLPSDTMYLIQSYVITRRMRSLQVLLSASTLSLWGGLGVMLSLMEGFRRAYDLPPSTWGFWRRRLRALQLVPIALAPLSVATLMLVFGRQIELWMVDNARHEMRYMVLFFWRMVRWLVAVLTSLTVLSALYHFGTRRKEHWLWVAPGALAGTVIWFPATLAYGWMSPGTPTIPCSTALSPQASRRWSGFSSRLSAFCWERN